MFHGHEGEIISEIDMKEMETYTFVLQCRDYNNELHF